MAWVLDHPQINQQSHRALTTLGFEKIGWTASKRFPKPLATLKFTVLPGLSPAHWQSHKLVSDMNYDNRMICGDELVANQSHSEPTYNWGYHLVEQPNSFQCHWLSQNRLKASAVLQLPSLAKFNGACPFQSPGRIYIKDG